MVQFRPEMHDYRIQHPVQIYTCSITQYYLNSITLKQRNSLDKMKMVYIVNTLQHDRMKCRSIRQEFHSLSWNKKSPSSNISVMAQLNQALLTLTRLVSTSSLSSKHDCSHEGCPLFKSHLWSNSPMPHACLTNIITFFFHRIFETD